MGVGVGVGVVPVPEVGAVPEDEPGARPELIAHPTQDRATDRCAAEEHDRLQRQHPAAHLRVRAQLHDRRRRGHEDDAGEADEDGERERGDQPWGE